MSTDEKLKIVASSALRTLFCSRKVSVPIAAFDLLARVIASGPPPAGLLPGPEPAPAFRLTDLARFERILECLSREWDFGRIIVSRENDGGLTVLDVQLGQAYRGQSDDAGFHGRKRKRIVDEDADSAAGDLEEDDEHSRSREGSRKPAPTTLDSLSKDMKEVYALLQRGTARGRLLAEQVTTPSISIALVITYYVCVLSFILSTQALSPSAQASPRRSVLKPAVPRQATSPLPYVTLYTSVHSYARTQIPRWDIART